MMRLDVEFPRPLDRQQRTRALVAIATLTKATKVRFIKGDRVVVIMAEALSARRVQEELTEAGLAPEQVISSLDPEIDAHCDDAIQDAASKERFRAIGR